MKDLLIKLEAILLRHKEIELKLSDQNTLDTNLLIKLNKEYASLTLLTEKIINYKKCKKNIDNLQDLLKDKDILIRNEAEIELKEVARLSPFNYRHLIYLAEVRNFQKNWDEAKKLYVQAFKNTKMKTLGACRVLSSNPDKC